MRWTQRQLCVDKNVKTCFAFTKTVCEMCKDTVWLERMYTTYLHIRYVCRECCSSKEIACECFYPPNASTKSAIERNRERQLTKEKEKVAVAVHGLESVIANAVNSDSEWNPEKEKIVAGVVTDVENILKELDEIDK